MSITDFGLMAKGKAELAKHDNGKRLTYRQMCLAKCYECCVGYTDGKIDCQISGCPLYHMMPYKKVNDSAVDPKNTVIQKFKRVPPMVD